MIWLKQSTARTIKFGPFLDKTDGVALESGLAAALDNATTGIRVSKNGGAYVDRASATVPTYDAMGDYNVELDMTDTDTLGVLKIIFEEAATCLPVWEEFMVVPTNVWDSLFGSDKLEVDVTQLAGVIQSLTDLKDFADTGYDPAANKVQGVVLCDTVTSNSDMRGTDSAGTAANLATVDTVVDAIKAVTDLLPDAGALNDLATILADTGELQADDVPGLIAALNDLSAAEVNTEVVDVLKVDTIAQLAQQAPPAAPTFEEAFMYLYQYFRNKMEQTSSEISMYDDAGTTVIAKASKSDDTTTYTKGEFATGP